jgi:hypothetical protein
LLTTNDCGFEARAEDEGELIAQVQRHTLEAHGMVLTTEQTLLLAFRAQLGETAWSHPGVRASTEDIKRSRQRGRGDS